MNKPKESIVQEANLAVEEPKPSTNDQSHSLQESQIRVTPGLSQSCTFYSNLDKKGLENTKSRYYSMQKVEEDANISGCKSCLMLCWIASDFLPRGKGPGGEVSTSVHLGDFSHFGYPFQARLRSCKKGQNLL